MSESEFIMDGLDEAEQALSKMIETEYPKEFEKLVIQIAMELQGRVKEHTPVDTSRLQDHWFVGDIKHKGNDYVIEVYNNTEYALPVEHGHRIKNSKKKKVDRKKKRFVKGAHMMEISLDELNRRLPLFMQDWLSNFLDTHEVF